MAHVRTANIVGTAAELAEQSKGYAADGVSAYTHKASSDKGKAKGPSTRGRHRDIYHLIAAHMHALAKLEARLLIEDIRVVRQKIRSDIAIKKNFIARLEAERDENERTRPV